MSSLSSLINSIIITVCVKVCRESDRSPKIRLKTNLLHVKDDENLRDYSPVCYISLVQLKCTRTWKHFKVCFFIIDTWNAPHNLLLLLFVGLMAVRRPTARRRRLLVCCAITGRQIPFWNPLNTVWQMLGSNRLHIIWIT